jgi:hypothetical protein
MKQFNPTGLVPAIDTHLTFISSGSNHTRKIIHPIFLVRCRIFILNRVAFLRFYIENKCNKRFAETTLEVLFYLYRLLWTRLHIFVLLLLYH